CLYMLSKAERLDVSLFAEAIKRKNITSAMMLPMSALKQFSLYATDKEVEAFRSLKYFGVGGEALTGETARLFQNRFGNVPLINVYGPTECSVLSTTYTVTDKVPQDLINVPIGKPLKNYSVYIVNENDQLNPIGVAGELLIETEGLSEGYLNLPEKTEEVFVRTHLTENLVYRSGDIVKLLEDGNIEFVGRKDSQVKIRGFRVEMGEIEDKLLQIDFLEDGAIVAKDVNGDKLLVAYYKQKDQMNGSQKGVLDFLTTKLPKYMIPSYIIELDELPHLPSGKINRKELTARPIELSLSIGEDKKEPSNEVEEKFVEAWKEVLGLSAIGVDENFFEIGGHSLKVLATLSKLKKDFPTLKINDFFIHPTIEALAQKIMQDRAGESKENVFSKLKVTHLYEHPKHLNSTQDYKIVSQTGVLLTGVTGYLGSHILIDLVRDTDTTIYTLVRAKSKAEGLERLKSTLSYYAPSNFYINYNLKDRVVVIPGDFTKADLGLSEEDYAMVREKVNSIIHCGADVRHFGNKEEFTKTNVDSTRILLNLAEQLSNARFHYVSTLGIPEDLAMEGHWDEFLKAANIGDAPEVTSLYTNSKLESEKLVEEYYKKGLPVTIYRPGNITCQYETGLFQKNINDNAVYRMLKGFILLGTAPDVEYKMDFTMVDFASKSITTIAMLDESIGGVYNICNPMNISYKEFIQAVRDFGYNIKLLPQQEYVDYLYSDQPKENEGLELSMAGLEGDGAKDSPLIYTCPSTLSILNEKGVKVPKPDKAFIYGMLEHAVKVGYFIRPAVLANL
ncbi:thioester reductase domain-containing protein, partial [Bacillus xiapuensis]|nr:thioester reductase domain-containing protein [Bacillus xiapuensis]